jgi:hypothetical protein
MTNKQDITVLKRSPQPCRDAMHRVYMGRLKAVETRCIASLQQSCGFMFARRCRRCPALNINVLYVIYFIFFIP